MLCASVDLKAMVGLLVCVWSAPTKRCRPSHSTPSAVPSARVMRPNALGGFGPASGTPVAMRHAGLSARRTLCSDRSQVSWPDQLDRFSVGPLDSAGRMSQSCLCTAPMTPGQASSCTDGEGATHVKHLHRKIVMIISTAAFLSSSPMIAAAQSYPGSALPGDVDGDCVVSTRDLYLVNTNYGHEGPNISGDANGDGKVDGFDLQIVIQHFGRRC
jgi:hypothetical protein